jgi:uncharacterized protein with FMN-binding domain
MKRALLIAGGTVGGLGAVLAITPPQLTSSGSINIAGGAAIGSTGTSSSASASSPSSTAAKPVATASAAKSAKPVATKKATAAASASATATTTKAAAVATNAPDPTPSATATKSADPTPAATKTTAAATTSKGVTGTFTGPAVFVNYGTVQVKITVSNGRITDAVAVQAPGGRNDRWTNMAVPILKQQTLAAQSANIKGASGASYTSYGWFKSLQGALADAGL